MRIIAGNHRGVALTPVGKGDEAAHLRPTGDRVRESLFNILSSGSYGDVVSGARVLDLFAGTGALGLEALSRGAARVCFVDNGRIAFKLLSKNISKLRAAEATNVLSKDATRLPKNPYAAFDLIFLDPPYGQELGAAALSHAQAHGWIAKGALIIWEDNAEQPAPTGFTRADARRYGETWITFLTA